MTPAFHLSIGVRSIEQSADFFTRVLRGTITHRDPSGYVNVDLFGCELTLKRNETITPELEDLHFGWNLGMNAFEELARHVIAVEPACVVMAPKTVDAGTPLERRKMYLRCPTGYRIELKGYGV
jgi:extradiol dioxygenase family protein